MPGGRLPTGGVEPRPSGAYRAKIRLGGYTYRQTFLSELRARAWLADLRVRYAEGRLSPPGAEGDAPPLERTVGEQLEAFLLAIRGTVSAKTHGEYARNARHHLKALHPLPLGALTAETIRRHRAALLAGTAPYVGQALQPTTLRNVLTVLRRALQQAVDDGLLGTNAAARVRPLKIEPPRQQVLSKQEQARLVADAAARLGRPQNARAQADRGDRLVALWLMALRTGARLSELLGLTWADVDVDAGRVMIWRQLDRPTGRRPQWKPTTKTRASVAPVHLPRSVVAALVAHRTRQDGERLRYGAGYQDFGLVFATRWGTPLSQSAVRKSWRQACVRAGVPVIPFHGTRHTAASTYLAAGATVPEVAAILRHASPHVTMRTYAHLVERYTGQAADRLDAFLDEDGTQGTEERGGIVSPRGHNAGRGG